MPGACGVSGLRRGALKTLRVQEGYRDDAPGKPDLAGLQLPAVHTGCITSSLALERGKAAFFRTCAFTHGVKGLGRGRYRGCALSK